MRRTQARSAWATALGLIISTLVVLIPGAANAAVPTLQWTAPMANPEYSAVTSSPTGNVTVGCSTSLTPTQQLTTYSSTGTVIQQIPQSPHEDGQENCMTDPVVDKNGDVYGLLYGVRTAGGWGYGPNMLAYSGNTLKWKYPVTCTSSERAKYAVGADGNIYIMHRTSGGDVRLIGLTPNVASGQTQPAKVLDIDVDNDCSSKLYAYKDGIVLHGQSSGHARYYSYAGKFLGQATVGDIWYEKINANGDLFVPKYVSGSFTSAKVIKYDPLNGQVAWERIISASGANVQSFDLYALPNGGTVSIVKQQVTSGGIPTTPTTYERKLVFVTANGVVTSSATPLPETVSGGGSYGNTRVYVDVNGKLVLVREMSLATNVSYPATVPGLFVGVYNPATDTWLYQQIMSGNTNGGNGSLYGYTLNYAGESEPSLGNGTLYVVASCSGSCPTANAGSKLYPIAISGIGMDYPRGAVLSANMPIQPTAQNYVALGDSYSSGQGAGSYDPYTTISTNQCYKSDNAYGKVLGRDPYSKFALKAFVACGGAVASDITTTKTYPDVSLAQKYAVDSTTQVVTLTIGGNDIGFAGVITTCANPNADCDAAFNQANTNVSSSVFASSLQSAYLAILGRNPTVKLYVLGYPPVFATGSSGCPVGGNGSSAPIIGAARVAKSLQLLANLNNAISTNVAIVKSLSGNQNRIEYVPATSASSPFNGHEVCTSDKYINGLTLPVVESFHPNKAGNQEGYASLVKVNI